MSACGSTFLESIDDDDEPPFQEHACCLEAPHATVACQCECGVTW